MPLVQLDSVVPFSLSKHRFDQVLAHLFAQYSRAQHQAWIRQGQARVNGELRRPKDKVQVGERVSVCAAFNAEIRAIAQDIPLDIVYQDNVLLVVNKPPGLVVHPGAGHWEGTLLNALLHYDASLSSLPRAGLLHRLDKDTSGLILVARCLEAYQQLNAAMQRHEITRAYEAIVQGHLISGGCIDAPVGRHPHRRTQMAVLRSGKPAVTHYRIQEHFGGHTHLRVWLETGRTHQIRVHLAHLGYPLVGDQTYLRTFRLPKGIDLAVKEAVRLFPRQALHATRLEFLHPISGQSVQFESPMPEDIKGLCNLLRKYAICR